MHSELNAARLETKWKRAGALKDLGSYEDWVTVALRRHSLGVVDVTIGCDRSLTLRWMICVLSCGLDQS